MHITEALSLTIIYIYAVLILLVTWSSQPLVSLGWNLLGPNVLTFVSIHSWLLDPYSCLSPMCWNFSLIASLSLAHIVQLIITAILSPLCETGLFPVAFLSFVSIHCWLPGAHSLKSPLYSFISIHCWLPGAHSLKSPLHWNRLPYCLPYLCWHTLLVTWSSQPLVSLVCLSAYSADLHSHLSPMCTFVSIHCWLPDCQSHLSPLCEAGLQVPCCLPYLCKHTLLFTLFSQLLVSLDWRPYCLPYLCQHTLLVTVASQSFVSIV